MWARNLVPRASFPLTSGRKKGNEALGTRLVRALMTRMTCAVGMRNAILRNHLKELPLFLYRGIHADVIIYIFARLCVRKKHVRNKLTPGS